MEPIRLYQDGQPGGGEFIPGTTVRDRSDCHACGQYCQIYRRALANVTAMVMIVMYRHNEGRDYINIPELFNTGSLRGGTGDASKGKYWGLTEPMPGERADGSNRVGWWRLTNLGRRFVLGEVTVAKYAHIYDDRRLWFSGTLLWSIHDALGERFNYNELMAG